MYSAIYVALRSALQDTFSITKLFVTEMEMQLLHCFKAPQHQFVLRLRPIGLPFDAFLLKLQNHQFPPIARANNGERSSRVSDVWFSASWLRAYSCACTACRVRPQFMALLSDDCFSRCRDLCRQDLLPASSSLLTISLVRARSDPQQAAAQPGPGEIWTGSAQQTKRQKSTENTSQ